MAAGLFLSSAAAREFTNLDGKKIEAEISYVDGENVVLTVGGRDYRYPIKQLVEADQAHIVTWQKENPIAIEDLRLDIKADEELLAKRRVNEDGRNQSIENRAYKVTIRNNGRRPVTGLVCYYKLFVKLRDRYAAEKITVENPVSAHSVVESIPAGGTVTFKTDPAMVTKGDNAVVNGGVMTLQKWREDLAGGNFHFYVGQQLVATHYVGSFKDQGAGSPEAEDEESDEEGS